MQCYGPMFNACTSKFNLLNTKLHFFYILLLQTAVGNNSQGDEQSMAKEVSVMETDHMADADDQVWNHWFPAFYFGLFI